MPNHITTVCTMTGSPSDLDRFQAAHFRMNTGRKEPCEFFDLGTVVPKPACVDATGAGSEDDAGFYAVTGFVATNFIGLATHPVRHYTGRGFAPNALSTHEEFAEWLAEHHPAVLAKGKAQFACLRETGHRSWYEWSYANWGTKWNTYDFKIREREPTRLVFQFDTANGVPEPIFEKLTEMYPEATFAIVSIDEGGPEYEGLYSVTEKRCEKMPENADRYRLVYGRDPYTDDEDDEETN